MFNFKLQSNEKLLKIHRQAEIVLAKPLLIVFVLIYAPWAFLIKYDLQVRFSRILLFWTLLVAAYAVYKYLLWLANVYIVTDKRLVAINYKSLIHKIVLETPLDRIYNISAETKGLARSLLKIGDVVVQIASLNAPMVLCNLKHPEEIKDSLWQVHNSQKEALKMRKVV